MGNYHEIISKIKGKKILLIYEKKEVRESGMYDEILDLLNLNNIGCIEISTISKNNLKEGVLKGKKFIVMDKMIDTILVLREEYLLECGKEIAKSLDREIELIYVTKE